MEINQFNKDIVEAGRKAGFTDDQIEFLTDFFAFASEIPEAI